MALRIGAHVVPMLDASSGSLIYRAKKDLSRFLDTA